MNCRFADFRCKEVINICDGCRLGYVGDVECRLPDGQLTALIVPGPYRFFGLFADRGRHRSYRQALSAPGDPAQRAPHAPPVLKKTGGSVLK